MDMQANSTAELAVKGTDVGRDGVLTYGGVSGDVAALKRFANEVSILESMDLQGLIRLVGFHKETLTGQKFVTRVAFRRVK